MFYYCKYNKPASMAMYYALVEIDIKRDEQAKTDMFCTQRNIFKILLNQSESKLYLQFSD